MQQFGGYAGALPLALGRYKRELLWIAAGLLLVLPLGYAANLRVEAANDLRQGVVLLASGSVTVDRVEVMAEVTGLVRDLPEKGARVTSGQPVARLENPDLQAAVVLARSQLDVARAGLARAQAPVQSADQDDLDTAIKLATVALEAAQKATDSLHAGINAAASSRQYAQATLNQELQAAQAKANQTNVPHHAPTATNSTATNAAAIPMGGHGSSTAQPAAQAEEEDCEVHTQLRELTRVFQNVTVPVAAADQTISAARDTSLMEQLMAQVEIARINLEQAKARKAKASAAPRAEDSAEAHAKVQQAQIALTLAEQKLQRTSIISPVSGLVLDVPVKRGAPVNIGQPLVVLSNDVNTAVTIRVRHKAAESVKTGQKAVTTVNGEALDGRVAAVTPDADSAWTVIKVVLEPTAKPLTDGMSAKVKILADSASD